ncbi:hypothetical protein JL720_3307 [Aureococcus anophagefferens]|nr:hypothetical protein JL720_3307 [Aureococcus anophagefferens]
MGALAALRLAALGDGLFLSQLDATLTLVNEALRLAAASTENPTAAPVHLARAPRVSGRGDRADGLDGVAEVGTDDDDDAALVFPLDTLSAWRVGHDWAQVDLAAVARQAARRRCWARGVPQAPTRRRGDSRATRVCR